MIFERLKALLVKGHLLRSNEELKRAENICCKCNRVFPINEIIRYKRFLFCRKCWQKDRLLMLLTVIGAIVGLTILLFVVTKKP